MNRTWMHGAPDQSVLPKGLSFTSELDTEQEPLFHNDWGPATFECIDSLSAGKCDRKACIPGHLYKPHLTRNLSTGIHPPL
jgi:hypothetical protein